MDTAPKDGTRVLLYGLSGYDIGKWQNAIPEELESGVRVVEGCEAGWWGAESYWPDEDQPSHWMPLPEPPA